jgi:hypothetical protein
MADLFIVFIVAFGVGCLTGLFWCRWPRRPCKPGAEREGELRMGGTVLRGVGTRQTKTPARSRG